MFDRLERLIGTDSLNKLHNTHILLVGLGGVGGISLEALIRSGVGNIHVIDKDIFELSNLNRQILSDINNIYDNKVDVAIKRGKSINKDINITGEAKCLTVDDIDKLGSYDFIIDACDDVKIKIGLIKYARKNNIPIICAMGTGKRLDPTMVKISTLDKTYNDPLAKKMRQELKKEHLNLNVPIVYSPELPLNHDSIIASSIFVPSTAGLYLAYYVIDKIITS